VTVERQQNKPTHCKNVLSWQKNTVNSIMIFSAFSFLHPFNDIDSIRKLISEI